MKDCVTKPKKKPEQFVSIRFPKALLEKVDQAAKKAKKTRSEFFRDTMRAMFGI
jgi:metal-responsive CopG/Arc/MetJ family transcriptional regulator